MQGSDPLDCSDRNIRIRRVQGSYKKKVRNFPKIHCMRNILLKLLTGPSQPCVKEWAYHGNCSEKLMIHDNTLRGLDPCGPFTLLSFRREPHFLKMQILDTGVNFAFGGQGTKEEEKGSEVLTWRTSKSHFVLFLNTSTSLLALASFLFQYPPDVTRHFNFHVLFILHTVRLI